MRYMVVIEEGWKRVSWRMFPICRVAWRLLRAEDEVKKLIQEAIEFHLEDLAETSAETPKPLSKSEYIEVLAV